MKFSPESPTVKLCMYNLSHLALGGATSCYRWRAQC